MKTQHIIVAENRQKFSEEVIKSAFKSRYNSTDIEVNDKIITISINDKSYKQFYKIAKKNYEKAIEEVVYEDFEGF